MFEWSDRVKEIRNCFRMSEFLTNSNLNKFDPNPDYIFPYEYLQTLNSDYLDIILKNRNLPKSGTKKKKILRILRYGIRELSKFCEDEDLHIHTTNDRITNYLKNVDLPIDGTENQLLRLVYGCHRVDISKQLICVNKLDSYIINSPRTLDKDVYVYRSISEPQLIYIDKCVKHNNVIKKCQGRNDAFLAALNTKHYSSTSLDIEASSDYTRNNCCILRFKIPNNIDYLDTSLLIGDGRFDDDELSEVLLQRNITYYDFKYIGKYTCDNGEKKMVIDCKIARFDTGQIDYDDEIKFIPHFSGRL